MGGSSIFVFLGGSTIREGASTVCYLHLPFSHFSLKKPALQLHIPLASQLIPIDPSASQLHAEIGMIE